MAKQPPQIGADLSSEEHDAFRDYADSLHLKDSALANLLIARELRRRRLAELVPKYLRQVTIVGNTRPRITAHQGASGIKEAFQRHAAEHGLGPGAAAAVIFRAELTERWLERCISFEQDESI